jgi:PhzF family phenazine biosynthesis protein
MILFQIDAFSDQPFSGNPAGVCLLDGPRPDAWMQSLAMEMNLSETAFLLPEAGETGEVWPYFWQLRWFTPTVEVELCGHATLASTHALHAAGLLPEGQTAHFHTRSGLLTAAWRAGWIELNFPARPCQPAAAPEGLLDALGVKQALAVQAFHQDYLVEVAEEATVRALQPDFGRLLRLPIRDVMVTSRGTGKYDFVSRLFAPAMGINEDPVTGSAHCVLVPYWSAKMGKTEFQAYQASSRGGELRLRLLEDRVSISGQAVTIFKTEI